MLCKVSDLLQLLDRCLMALQRGLNDMCRLLFALSELFKLLRVALLLSQKLLILHGCLLRLLRELLCKLSNLLRL